MRCTIMTRAVHRRRRNKVQTLRKTQEDADAEDFKACAEHFVRCAAIVFGAILAS